MATLKQKILLTSDDIDLNIDQLLVTGRGFVSRNVLKQLRVLVEQVIVLIHLNDLSSEVDYSTKIKPALSFIHQQGQYRFLYDFHEKLNAVMHTSLTNEDADMLMINYGKNLFYLKKLCYEIYQINILKNIKNYPIDLDPGLKRYYEEIVTKMKNHDYVFKSKNNPFYIEKVKPLIIDGEIFYEVTFRKATNRFSKYDKVVAFTKKRITTKYALKLSLAECRVSVDDIAIEALLIIDFDIYIRPCEIMHLGRFFEPSFDYKSHTTEYNNLAESMKKYRISLLNIVLLEDARFEDFLTHIQTGTGMRDISNLLIKLRDVVYHNKPGANVLRYLITNVNNVIIKKQFINVPNKKYLSGLYIKNGSKVFDDMPICSNLLGHYPRITTLLECIPLEDKEYELTARMIHQNTRKNKKLFIPIEDLGEKASVVENIEKFNLKIWSGHRPNREIHFYQDHVYMHDVERKCVEIVNILRDISKTGDGNHETSVTAWLANTNHGIDDDIKKNILLNLFKESQVAFIYGPAGTGKTLMIEHISAYFSEYNKVYLANTNSAKGNLESRIQNKENTEFSTVRSYLDKSDYYKNCDILIIDECSTVSNDDFHTILKLGHFKKIVLVGDIFQIESIDFGNWFHFTKMLMDKKCIYELDVTRRTNSEELKKYWSAVRDSSPKLLEQASLGLYSQPISNLFNSKEKDQIVLCLNYDGLYGINNLNKLLQEKNKNDYVEWDDVNKYKVDDPIVFSHVDRFFPILFNNLKGIIHSIEKGEGEIKFIVEISRRLHSYHYPEQHDVFIIDNLENGNTLVSFTIHETKTNDDDEDDDTTIVPFQVSYATSIHKAQGLEYENVKIVVVNEIQEQITHSIFYTAITRSTKNLFLFWSPETAEKIYTRLTANFDNKDVYLLKAKNTL